MPKRRVTHCRCAADWGSCPQLAYLGLYDVALDEAQVRCGAALSALGLPHGEHSGAQAGLGQRLPLGC